MTSDASGDVEITGGTCGDSDRIVRMRPVLQGE